MLSLYPTASPMPPAGLGPYRDDGDVDVTEILTAFGGLYEAATRVTGLVAAELGIGVTDVRAMVFIGSTPGATPKAIAQHLDLSTGAITSLVDRITKADYARRVSHPTDRRSVMLELAPAGHQAVGEIIRFWSRAFRDSVDPQRLDFLAAAMRAVTAALEHTGTIEMTAR